MRPHRRRGPLEHVLVAGDAGEVEGVRALLALLPETAYGQVYVERTPDVVLPVLTAPPRVTVTHLFRDEDDEPGAALAGAVEAWLAEWIPDEPQTEREVAIWVGGSVRHRVHAPDTRLELL